MAAERQAETVKRKGAFSIPSVDEIREASKIGVGSKRSVFESRLPAPSRKSKPGTSQPAKDIQRETRGPPSEPSIPSNAEQPSSSGVTASTSGPDIVASSTLSATHPYAIIINPLQVRCTLHDL